MESDQNKIIGEIEKNLADKINCPKCDHAFILRDKKYDLKKAQKELEEAQVTKEDIGILIVDSQNQIAILNKDGSFSIANLLSLKFP